MSEPIDRAVTTVSIAGGVSEAEARRHIRAFHHVVDGLSTAGWTVVVPPLVVSQPNNPTWRRLKLLVKDDTWELPEGLDGTTEETAKALRLPPSELERYPVVGDGGVAVRVHDLLGIDDAHFERTLRMMEAWSAQFLTAGGQLRPYRVEPAGLEKDFEDWLEADLSRLAPFGYDVEAEQSDDVQRVRARQHVFPDRRRSDLIVRAKRDCDRMKQGDWLVIENKTTMVGSPAAEQLALYVDWLRHQLGGEATVHGLLIADGISVNLGRALSERGFDHLTLAQLGYRDVLWNQARPRVADPDSTTVDYPSSVAEVVGSWG